MRDLQQAIETVNAFAPEHLELCFAGAADALDDIRNAGSVFVGNDSPVVMGDYVGGTNHVLPSGGTARWGSGLGVNDFVKRIYVSGYEPAALQRMLAHIEALSEAEGLPAHARASGDSIGVRGDSPMTRPPLSPRPDLADLEPYVSPQQPARWRMNTNESPYPPPDAPRARPDRTDLVSGAESLSRQGCR